MDDVKHDQNFTRTRSRDEDSDDADRATKRLKPDDASVVADTSDEPMKMDVTEGTNTEVPDSLLPPSHTLLNAPPPLYTPDGSMQRIMETDVGISEYIGRDVPQIAGIIKQR